MTTEELRMPRIGITERGDAGLDLRWAQRLPARCDGAVLITKRLTDAFILKVMRLHGQGFPLIVHATCTGLGGSVIEPRVPRPSTQMHMVRRLHRPYTFGMPVLFRIYDRFGRFGL